MDGNLYYRADPDDARPIDVLLMADGQPPIKGRAIDVYTDGIGVRLPRGTALPLGMHVELGLSVPHASRPVALSAVVRARKEGRSFRRYGFRFTSREEIEEKIPQGLYSIFNRRRAERYYLSEKMSVSVIPDCRFEPLPAKMGDVSMVGSSVIVEPRCENVLAGSDRMQVRVEADTLLIVDENGAATPAAEPLAVDVIVHNRILLDSGVRYGCEFDPSRDDTVNKAQILVDFVLHQERLREAADGG
ncbi:MAG: PilZ domain-containing protein [Myxococcota bacterium]